ncbi:MAG: DUF362 domain-containing protein [Candidatus Zhuqueibacterota bacterium]
MKPIDRRQFLKTAGAAGLALSGFGSLPFGFGREKAVGGIDLSVVQNGEPAAMVRMAIEVLGGIGKFVNKGDVVVVKPNIGWDRVPEQAATTNPDVVAEIVNLCVKAGASRVKVFDNTCNEARRCYMRSEIESAAEKAGADVSFMYDQKYKKVTIEKGIAVQSWEFYQDALEADVFINVPIAKHHSLSRVTLGMKNMMGIIGGNRGKIHNQFEKKIVDMNLVVRPQLTIIDAVRMLMANGPVGGNLNDVKKMDTIIAGVDIVAVDAYGATLFGHAPEDLGFIREAHQRGLGTMNLKELKIEKVNLAA